MNVPSNFQLGDLGKLGAHFRVYAAKIWRRLALKNLEEEWTGWDEVATAELYKRKLLNNAAEGDWLDVGALAFFLWFHENERSHSPQGITHPEDLLLQEQAWTLAMIDSTREEYAAPVFDKVRKGIEEKIEERRDYLQKRKRNEDNHTRTTPLAL